MAVKADIVESVANGVEGLTKKQAADAFDTVFNSIASFLATGDRVQLPGFGSFSVNPRPERQGRNPATGEAITIKASNAVRFKVGKELKAAVNR